MAPATRVAWGGRRSACRPRPPAQNPTKNKTGYARRPTGRPGGPPNRAASTAALPTRPRSGGKIYESSQAHLDSTDLAKEDTAFFPELNEASRASPPIRPEACPSAEARARVAALLAGSSLDDLVAIASNSLESRIRSRISGPGEAG